MPTSTNRPPSSHPQSKVKLAKERRTQILQAAMKVLSKKGFYGVTISDIAKEARMSPGTIYLYFDNKEELLNALGQEALPLSIPEDMLKHAGDGNGRETLERLAADYLETFVKQGRDDMIKLFILRTLRSTKRLRALYEEMSERMFTRFEQHLRNGIEDGSYRDVEPQLAARTFVGMFLPFVIMADVERRLHIKASNTYEQDQVITTVVDIFLHGISGKSGPAPAESRQKSSPAAVD